MSEKITYLLKALVEDGPVLTETNSIYVDAYDKLVATVPAGDSVTVDLQPASGGQFLVILADAYTGFSVSNAVLVKIQTDEGHTGYGEACAWEPEFYGETIESVSSTIKKYIEPAIIGEDPGDISRIMAKIDGIVARITCAKEGIDLALHDLLGKILDVPVYVLLGGKYRDMIPVGS